MKSDQELIKDFQKGNNHAFNTLVEKHLYNTIGFFIKITGNQSEAEDLAPVSYTHLTLPTKA